MRRSFTPLAAWGLCTEAAVLPEVEIQDTGNSQLQQILSSHYFLKCLCGLNLDAHFLPDLTLIQQEVDALEELSRQLFLETADLYATKVQSKATAMIYLSC